MADFNSDDFNSDDYEQNPAPVNPYAHLGAKSIEAMFESRFEDRQSTKKRMDNLQDTKGAPGSVENRALVMVRFEAYLTRVRGLRPANPTQVNLSIKAAGLVAGVLVPVVSHDIRAGAARDASMLRTRIQGVASPHVAKILGHNYKSLSNGTTDRYVGGEETAVNAEVAKNPKAGCFGLQVGDEGYVRHYIPTARITEVCIENGLDQNIRKDRMKAIAMIEEERQRAERDSVSGTSEGGLDAVQDKARSTPNLDELVDPRLRGLDTEGALHDTGVQGSMFDSCPVDQSEASYLESLLSSTKVDTEDIDDPKAEVFEERAASHSISDAIDRVIAENRQSAQSLPNEPRPAIELDSTPFVDYFSRINTVRNSALAQGIHTKDYLKHVPVGNTRDTPTLFEKPCKNANLGCKFTSVDLKRVKDHALTNNCIVSQSGERIKAHQCPRDGCNRIFTLKSHLNSHIRNTHDWVPKKCERPDCPKADVLWDDGDKYKGHLDRDHDDWTPTKCLVPDCKSDVTFETRTNYDGDLRRTHKLVGKEQEAEKQKYLPRRRVYVPYVPQKCPLGGCKSTTTFAEKKRLVAHLKDVHKD
ncbi:hypothetical protein diail_8947 [Diaporthe ilicicola]|nr:hypothetical protein diail_8947 [Diaporthe ilicicola]